MELSCDRSSTGASCRCGVSSPRSRIRHSERAFAERISKWGRAQTLWSPTLWRGEPVRTARTCLCSQASEIAIFAPRHRESEVDLLPGDGSGIWSVAGLRRRARKHAQPCGRCRATGLGSSLRPPPRRRVGIFELPDTLILEFACHSQLGDDGARAPATLVDRLHLAHRLTGRIYRRRASRQVEGPGPSKTCMLPSIPRSSPGRRASTADISRLADQCPWLRRQPQTSAFALRAPSAATRSLIR